MCKWIKYATYLQKNICFIAQASALICYYALFDQYAQNERI
jgi:hypothetical protein